MDAACIVENYGGMPSKKPALPDYKLYLSEWMARLKKRPVDLARHLGVGESYISNLRSLRKSNPSLPLLIAISEFLGITVNDLCKPPPKAASIGDLHGYSQAAVERLLAANAVDRTPRA